MTTDSDRQEVQALIEAWNESVNTNDPERILTLVSDDLEMIPPGEAPVHGERARRLLAGFFQFDLTLDGSTIELVMAGDWAIRRYQYQLTLSPKAGGQPTMMKGHGIHVLKRDNDSRWRFAKDIWN